MTVPRLRPLVPRRQAARGFKTARGANKCMERTVIHPTAANAVLQLSAQLSRRGLDFDVVIKHPSAETLPESAEIIVRTPAMIDLFDLVVRWNDEAFKYNRSDLSRGNSPQTEVGFTMIRGRLGYSHATFACGCLDESLGVHAAAARIEKCLDELRNAITPKGKS